MYQAPTSIYRIEPDSDWDPRLCPTGPEEVVSKGTMKERLQEVVKETAQIQRALQATRTHSVLLVFQAMDAAGKDSTIRAVLSGLNPAGINVREFKRPTEAEYDHDYLWRLAKELPGRGEIGVFNRSHYEEVLAVRVHPEILNFQRLPSTPADLETLWQERIASMRAWEEHLTNNGTLILKFFLNLSREEQKNRFLERMGNPKKYWKIEPADIRERGYWDDYMDAYQAALPTTSTEAAPWYCIPADSKPYMRVCVAEILLEALQGLNLSFPDVGEAGMAKIAELKASLLAEEE
jgi:PPK2 family polyphosphate:nucleotide phosphotransferase